jgi:hypothetical protein
MGLLRFYGIPVFLAPVSDPSFNPLPALPVYKEKHYLSV